MSQQTLATEAVQPVAEIRPQPVIMTAQAYHQDLQHDSHSSLELFREDPWKYAAVRIAKTQAPDEPTAAMKFGSAVHCLILESNDFQHRFQFFPKINRRTKVGKQFHQWLMGQGKDSLSYDDACRIMEVINSLMQPRHKLPAELLFECEGVNEKSFFWADEATGLPLKMRPDRMLDCGLIVDVKIVDGPVSPHEFRRKVRQFGYARQADFYLRGAEACGLPHRTFAFVAISAEWPFHIAVYELSHGELAEASLENDELLKDLAERKRTNNWLPEWSGKIVTLGD